MQFAETRLPRVFLVDLDRVEDDRGFFARSFCAEEFRREGLDPTLSQCNVSYNHHRGTLRGMHLQIAPDAEAKLVRVTRGAIFDVALDLRPDSPRFREWVGFRLDAENHRALYLPEGVAHGFLTLEDDSEVFYQMSHPHAPTSARGFRHDDPAFGIDWPEPVVHISDRDRSHPFFEPSALVASPGSVPGSGSPS